MGSLSTPGTLKILVIGAENLEKIVTAGTQQPYYIIECGKQRSRSKPCLQNGTNPHWNTAHKFELLDETAAVAVIKDEMTKGIIAEGLIDLSRARLTGRDAATAQLRNLAGQPAGRLRFKLKFQAATAAAAGPAAHSLPGGQRLSDAGGRPSGGIHPMVDGDRRPSPEPDSSLPYSRRVSEANSHGGLQQRVSETGSYRSTGSEIGRRSITPTGSVSYSAVSLDRRGSGGFRPGSQQQLSRRQSTEEPDVVLASVNSKVSLAKQAMQQLTAELAELTGPSGQSPPPAGLHPPLSPNAGSGSLPPSAFAVAAAQHTAGGSSMAAGSRSSSRQGGIALNVLGQPVHAGPAQQGQLQHSAWSDYKSVYQQQHQHQHQHQHQRQQQRPGAMDPYAAPMGDAPSWASAVGQEMPMPLYQQQQYNQRQYRFSTGSMSPSGHFTPTDSMSPRSGVVMGPDGMPLQAAWAAPRLRGVFGNGVLSTEELVALYADSGAPSEKKLISLLEEALAAAHAEKVATEQELSTVKQAMAEMSKQHYLDAKRLKEMTVAAAAAGVNLGGSTHPAAAPRSLMPPPGFRQETPPASPHGVAGGTFMMVDTKPSRSRQNSQQGSLQPAGSGDARDISPGPLPRGLAVATGRESLAAGPAAATPDSSAAQAELTKLRGEHTRLQAASAALEQEVARLNAQAQASEGLQKELQQLKEQQAAEKRRETKATAAAAGGAAVGVAGAAAAAAAAAELEALRNEHSRVRALAESLEDEVAQLRGSAQQLQEAQAQLEDLQAEHASIKTAFATTQQQLEKLRQQQLDSRSVRSGSEFQDAAEDFDSGSSQGGSPMPAYKLQIQVHQLERQLVEQASKTQEEASRRQKLASELQALQEQFDSQVALAKQAEDNARAAETKAAEQATIAAAARAEVAEARASTVSSSGKEAQLVGELALVRDDLEAALADRAELETALGLLDRNSKAQIEQLQAELAKAQEEAASLREGSSDVATLKEQLAAVQEEATGLRNNSEEVEYLQAQLRRTLRQVVELQRQVQLLQQERSSEASAANPDQEAALEAAIRAETDFLMQELVAAKLELAQVKEQQLITQRQLFKAQESMKQQHNGSVSAINTP